MRSHLEMEVDKKLQRLKQFFVKQDRFVIIGVVLSFTPFFPACLLGVIISSANIYIGTSGRLSDGEIRLARFGVIIGFCFTVIWLIVLTVLNPIPSIVHALYQTFSYLVDLINQTILTGVGIDGMV